MFTSSLQDRLWSPSSLPHRALFGSLPAHTDLSMNQRTERYQTRKLRIHSNTLPHGNSATAHRHISLLQGTTQCATRASEGPTAVNRKNTVIWHGMLSSAVQIDLRFRGKTRLYLQDRITMDAWKRLALLT